MKKSILPLLLVSHFLLCAEMAYANVPIGAAAFLAYPTVSYLTSSAVALIIAVVLESLIFWIITRFKPLEVLSTVFLANLVSSLFGVAVVISFSSSYLFFIMLIPMAYALGKMFKNLCEETDSFRKTRKFHFVISIIFLFVCLVFGSLLLPATDSHIHNLRGTLSLNMIAVYSAIMIILGFAMTNLIEAYVVNKRISVNREGVGRLIVKAVFAMNLCSYIVLSTVYGKSIFGFVLKAA